MSEYLIVDGYNVINSWKEFAQLRRESYEHCREKLIASIAEYAAYKGQYGIVVFDAMDVSGPAVVERLHGIEVVYSGEDETADSWIERRAYELGKQKEKVFVVTSDYAEQINVLGAGAYRISTREFHEDYIKAKKEIASRLKIPNKAMNRNELGGRVQGDVLAYLERMRRL